jgi:peptidoglycan/xylan/chitin deacetylase (PgdA/CDA1 family)
VRIAIVIVMLAGCQQDIASMDSVFYAGGSRPVHCAVNLDSKARNDDASIDGGLDRALQRNEVVELYAHHPGVTVPVSKIEHVLAGAQERGLAFVTYGDFARGTWTAPGIALSLDDSSVDAWYALRDLFAQYNARVTFFVTRYSILQDSEKAELAELAADGHELQAHTAKHLRAPEYVDDHGLDAYMAEEAQPSIDVLRGDGYDVQAFAYPFGARTDELDTALLGRVPVLRSVAFSVEGAVDPCPL